MGLIKAGMGAAGGVLADQWKEFIYCEAIPADILAVKGQKKTSKRSSNTKGSENIITSGSSIAVADGQCMLIVEQGKVVEVCAEPGEFVYDASTEPSIFAGGLNKESLKAVWETVGKRFTFGGEAPKDQRVYFINTKEIMGNKYGTPSPVPFRCMEENTEMMLTVNIRCFGEYSFRITNPLLFYTNVCGNISEDYGRSNIESQMKSELLMHLGACFARLSAKGAMYTDLPGYAPEMADILNDLLSKQWRDRRGIEIDFFGVTSVKADEADEQRIKDFQDRIALSHSKMARGNTVRIMETAAGNSGGSALGFMGMGMMGAMGGAMGMPVYGQQQPMEQDPQQAAPADSWQCSCGHMASGKFCMECGAKKPEPQQADSWTCPSCGKPATGKFCMECGTKKPEQADGWICPTCGKTNKGKFCGECGTKKPAGVPQYRCDKCGWEPEDPTKPPKFCPECGDPFGDEDII